MIGWRTSATAAPADEERTAKVIDDAGRNDVASQASVGDNDGALAHVVVGRRFGHRFHHSAPSRGRVRRVR